MFLYHHDDDNDDIIYTDNITLHTIKQESKYIYFSGALALALYLYLDKQSRITN